MLAGSAAVGQEDSGRPSFNLLEQLGPIGGLSGPGSQIDLSGEFELAEGAREGRLSVTAVLLPTWHVYSTTQPPGGPMKTEFIVDAAQPFEVTGSFVPDQPPEVKETSVFPVPVEEHHERVTWTAPIRLNEEVDPEALQLRITVKGQVCQESCLPFKREVTADFAGYYQPGPATEPAGETSAEPNEAVASGGFDRNRVQIAEDARSRPLWMALGLALAGGFILNFMPCVLPVIGLKVMAFVQQAGESRARAFALNVWYSLGLISVFVVLATLAVIWNFGWGQQNQSAAFNITMAAIVFVMGLSFLGIWEIPIPGFVGSGKPGELAAQEGALGATAKGVITTILAVPCTGPLIGTVLFWSGGQSPLLVYAAFGCMGLGMAFPYLVIGAFPNLIRFLPKPGAWMETFKHVMGFVLLATVVWILSYLQFSQMLPTLTFLFGLWAACWLIGGIPVTADWGAKVRSWASAGALATAVGMIAFMWLDGVMEQRFAADVEKQIAAQLVGNNAGRAAPETQSEGRFELPWQPFSIKTLEELTAGGNTVMVDFTADWCWNCKVLESTVLNTAPVKSVVEQNGVIPLIADWTRPTEEVDEMLELLGGKGVPVLAIFPASSPNQPIVLRDLYTRQLLIQKLQEAGPSQAVADRDSRGETNVLARRRAEQPN